MRIALDSNVLVYAEGVNGADRRRMAIAALKAYEGEDILIPVQALGELFAVLTRKARVPAAQARDAVLAWADTYEVIDTRASTLVDAMELVVIHTLSPWDAVIVAAAAGAGCRMLLSEDMQSGFTWRGLTLRNPFEGQS
ncbi:MAG: PIN domain-containing protein [Caulobacteraceae bacterium]